MGKKYRSDTWQKVAPWYNKIAREGGTYYHQHVVIPGTLRLLNLDLNSNLLDLACGNGVLAKALPKDVDYTGIDIAPGLISEAKRTDRNPKHNYLVADATKPLSVSKDFTHATIILAFQNVENPQKLLLSAKTHLVSGGRIVIVLNHPAFRIPRQSSWGVDEKKKMQFRRIDRYLTRMNIPINMNPGDRNSKITMSYHFPIADITKMLKKAGFVIEEMEEWASDKESVGSAGKMENRARAEIPLFLAILATLRR